MAEGPKFYIRFFSGRGGRVAANMDGKICFPKVGKLWPYPGEVWEGQVASFRARPMYLKLFRKVHVCNIALKNPLFPKGVGGNFNKRELVDEFGPWKVWDVRYVNRREGYVAEREELDGSITLVGLGVSRPSSRSELESYLSRR